MKKRKRWHLLIKKNKFKCAVCGEEFEKGQSDKEAEEELERNYPGYTIEDCELTCDDCYNKPFFKSLRNPLTHEQYDILDKAMIAEWHRINWMYKQLREDDNGNTKQTS